MARIEIVGAGAGSGKTFTLTAKVLQALEAGARPSGIFATTYTIRAAAELKDRIRKKLVEEGQLKQAAQLDAALIGTVHSTFATLVRRYAFDLGLSPGVDIIGEEDDQMIFRSSLAGVIDTDRGEELDSLVRRFIPKAAIPPDWRNFCADLAEQARVNRIGPEDLRNQADASVQDILCYLPEASNDHSRSQAREQLRETLPEVIRLVNESSDDTKVTALYMRMLEAARNTLSREGGVISWPDWCSLRFRASGKRTAVHTDRIREIVAGFESFPELRGNITRYIQLLFEVAADALASYEKFKRERGLLDFVDLEVKMVELLEIPSACARLGEEIDALFVDEFQDTSPIQLEAFLKLTRLVDKVVWVGDPKQSIFAFRNAEPKLMGAVVSAVASAAEIENEEEVDLLLGGPRSMVKEESIASKALEKSLRELAEIEKKAEEETEIAQEESPKASSDEQIDDSLSDLHAIGPKSNSVSIGDFPEGYFNRLESNYRSRPEIVNFCNAVFSRVFRKSGIGVVGLHPVRSSKVRHTDPIRLWSFGDQRKVSRTSDQAFGIVTKVRRLLQQGLEVEDKVSKKMRPLRPRDVAILARRNSELSHLAAAFKLAGIPAAVSAPGLLSAPESRLLTSLLRRVLDSSDSLAVAELLVLGESRSVGSVLDDRLRWLATKEDKVSEDWHAEYEPVAALDELGRLRSRLSPSEMMDAVIVRTELRARVSRWGNAEARNANLEACRSLARQYERQQRQLGNSATLGGMLRWWQEIQARRLDYVDVVPGADAVQLLTYHKSKGLEWPVVICCSISEDVEPRLWGVSTIDYRPQPDLANLLEGRRVRFRFHPFGERTQKPEFYRRLQEREFRDAFNQEVAEARRLLYVGFTRPRDYLIIVDGRKNSWLGSAWTGNNERVFNIASAWEDLKWKERRIEIVEEPREKVPQTIEKVIKEQIYAWPKTKKRDEKKIKKYLSPSRDLLFADDVSEKTGAIGIGDRIEVAAGVSDAALGDAVHAFMAADRDDRNPAERLQMAQAHLIRFGVEKHVHAQDLVMVSDRFRHYLEKQYPESLHHREVPVHARMEGQYIQGFIDWVVDQDDRLAIWDHKTFRGSREASADKLGEFRGQLAAYARLLRLSSGKEVVASVHWVLRGE